MCVQLVVVRGAGESPEWEEGDNRVLAAHGGRGGGRLAVTCAWSRPEETQVGLALHALRSLPVDNLSCTVTCVPVLHYGQSRGSIT